MIRKSLVELIFEAASIERWNDHIRPSRGFTELDKQSHKMLYAYVLAKHDENVDWVKLIEGGLFEFLQRIMITDIKPPIYHELMQKKGREINTWVLDALASDLKPINGGFYERFEAYLYDEKYAALEKKILEAAHYSATQWEFDIIYGMCREYYGIEDTKREINAKLEQLIRTVPAFDVYNKDQNLIAFTRLVGELRFQQRWSRSLRIPATSVMGHMFVVAMLSFLCSCELGACGKRRVNNFLGGLFHDLPEVLTRDIVSPVKSSVEGLDEIIKDIENQQMKDRIYPLIPSEWKWQLDYYTQDEFDSKICESDVIAIKTSEEISDAYNEDKYNPIDGEIIRGCDHLAAYVETYASITHGITSEGLVTGNRTLYEKYRNKLIGGIDFGMMFDFFKIY